MLASGSASRSMLRDSLYPLSVAGLRPTASGDHLNLAGAPMWEHRPCAAPFGWRELSRRNCWAPHEHTGARGIAAKSFACTGPDHGHRADDQRSPHVRRAHLVDPAQARSPALGILPGDGAEPCGKGGTALEALRVRAEPNDERPLRPAAPESSPRRCTCLAAAQPRRWSARRCIVLLTRRERIDVNRRDQRGRQAERFSVLTTVMDSGVAPYRKDALHRSASA